jgi:hypothetical protein
MTAFARQRPICSPRSTSRRARHSAPRCGYSRHERTISTRPVARGVELKR